MTRGGDDPLPWPWGCNWYRSSVVWVVKSWVFYQYDVGDPLPNRDGGAVGKGSFWRACLGGRTLEGLV